MTHPLVGTRVVLIETEQTYTVGKDSITSIRYETSDETNEMLLETFGTMPRVNLPGYAFTLEYRMGRTNVHIDKTGLITAVGQG